MKRPTFSPSAMARLASAAAAGALIASAGGCSRSAASPRELQARQQASYQAQGIAPTDWSQRPKGPTPYEYHMAKLAEDDYIGTMEVRRPDPMEQAYRELARAEDPELRLAILDRIVELDRSRQPIRQHIVEEVTTTVYTPPPPRPMEAEVTMAPGQ
jgi:hypothetical protein